LATGGDINGESIGGSIAMNDVLIAKMMRGCGVENVEPSRIKRMKDARGSDSVSAKYIVVAEQEIRKTRSESTKKLLEEVC
jgi:hypothetical protein